MGGHGALGGHAIFLAMNDNTVNDHRLSLTEVLDWMVEDGLVDRESAEALKLERRLHGGRVHPLIVIADQKWRSLKPPVRPLGL